MAASSSHVSAVFRFGVFELDVRTGELRRSGVRLNLQDQPLRILACLLERPGELVTREEIRQRLWPGDTFVDFEQGVNAAVKRLRETLSDSAESPRFVETVPRRGYRFIAPVEHNRPELDPTGHDQPVAPAGVQPGGGPPATRRWRHSGLIAAGAVAAVVVATIVAWLGRSAAVTAGPPWQVARLTVLTGSESGPTFSPDGGQVAFAWNGERQDNSDIYVKLVGSTEVRRLTTDTAPDFAPQWSPDGNWIAYVRLKTRTAHQIRLMSALGGSDRVLNDFPVRPPATWSPDGRYLVAGRAAEAGDTDQNSGIYVIPLNLGEPRAITRAEAPETDWWPAISPDGRRIAYAACGEPIYLGLCHVEVLDLDATLTPVGQARQLTPEPFWTIRGLAWSRDGQSVIYAARQDALFQIWRVGVDGRRPPVRVDGAGIEAEYPATTPSRDRLAFSQSTEDEDLFRLVAGGVAEPVARSSVKETNAQFSPDGRRIAFCSTRSGDGVEVWVADSDGANPDRLTRGPGRWQCSPTWSPDGRRVAFDSQAADRSWHVWTIEVDGGTPQPVTHEPGDQVLPTWSRDGRWIYYLRRLGKETDTWRTSGPTGPRERVTHRGSATRAWESPDGAGVLYQQRDSDSPLYFQPLTDGAPRQVIACVARARFSVGSRGIYYVPCQTPESVELDTPVRHLDLTTRHTRDFALLADLGSPAWGRRTAAFTVSPDGRTIFFSKLVSIGADLMLIENFR